MKIVNVYGPGCNRCGDVEVMIRGSATGLGVEVEIEKIIDPRSIAMAGVMSTPGISVDGTLVYAGGLPDAAKLEGWLAT